MKRLSRTKRILLIVALIVVIPSAAYAYFELNVGHGYVSIDAPTTFAISVAAPTGPALAPDGSSAQTIDFSVTNVTSSPQVLHSETYALTMDANGGIYDTISDTFVDACQSSWFSIGGGDGGVVLPDTLQPSQSLLNGQVSVTMIAEPNTNEDACENLSPQVDISGS